MVRRIFIIIISLFLFFSVIEICLRGIGYFYLLLHRGRIISQNSFKILCLGDSFTFGVGADSVSQSYPAQLEKLLNENYKDKHFEVVNLGVPGFNSSQVFNDLKKNIRRYNPDLLIVLTGINNESHLLDTNYSLALDNRKVFFQKIRFFLNRLRFYKLLRACVVNLKSKISTCKSTKEILKKQDLTYGGRDLRKIVEMHIKNLTIDTQRYKEAIAEFKQRIKLNPDDSSPHYQLGWLYKMSGMDKLAIEEFERSLQINPDDFWARYQLGWLYLKQGQIKLAREQFGMIVDIDHYSCAGEKTRVDTEHNSYLSYIESGLLYKEKGRYEEAIREFKNSIKIHPYHFWEHLRPHNELAQIYKTLGRYREAERELEAIIHINPGHLMAHLELERIYRVQSKNQSINNEELKMEREMRNLLKFDLSKIIEVAVTNNIKLILLTYPHINNYIRTTIREVASFYSVPVVDNFSLFAERIKNGESGIRFFPPYGHCNAKGYRIMAEEIYKILVKEKIIE